MKTVQFPAKAFHEALLGKKIKSNLKPFVEEYEKLNIPWIFESISILLTNMTNASIQPQIKVASMYAIKCIADTCEYVPLSMIQAYLLPAMLKIALYDPTTQDQTRGDTYFLKRGVENEQFSRLGFNYIKIATQLILALSVVKPRKFYDYEEVKDPSQFSLAKREIQKTLKHPPESFAICKDAPQKRKLFIEKFKVFDETKVDRYSQFADKLFLQELKQGFSSKKQLDIRQLMKLGDGFIVDGTLQLCGQALKKSTTCGVIVSVIQYINMLIQTGSFRALVFLYENECIKNLVQEVLKIPDSNKSLNRGQKFLNDKKGTTDQKKVAYSEFLRKLQFWAKTDAGKDLKDPSKPSKIAYYYQLLKNEKNFTFPPNPFLKKEIAQLQQKKKTFQESNRKLLDDIIPQIQESEKDDLIKNLKMSSNWSVVSDSPKSVKDQEKNSFKNTKVESIKEAPEKQEASKQIYNNPKKQQVSLKSETKIMNVQTPHGNNNLEELSYNSMMLRLKEVERVLGKLHKNQRQLPKSMQFLNEQIQQIEKGFQLIDLTQEELQSLMTKHFDLMDAINETDEIYKQYKTSKIGFKQFSKKIEPIRTKFGVSSLHQIAEQKVAIKVKEPQIRQMKQAPQQKVSEPRIESQQKFSEPKISQPRISQPKISEPKISQPKISQTKLSELKISESKFIEPKISEPKIGGQINIKKQHDNNLVAKHSQNHVYSSKVSDKNNDKGYLSPDKNQEKVSFQASSIGSQSKISERNYKSPNNKDQNILDNLSIQVSQLKEQEAYLEEQNYRPSLRKLNANSKNNIDSMHQINRPKKIHSQIKIQSPVVQTKHIFEENRDRSFSASAQLNEMRMNQFDDDDDQIIESPDLNPLDNSFHQEKQKVGNFKKKSFQNFKDALGSDNFAINIGKKEKMFWLKSETQSLIKPAQGNQRRSRVQSKISVPEILQQRNKKHESELRLLEEDRDKKIRDLKSKLMNVERQKSNISSRLKQKQIQIQSLKQQSEIGSKLSPNRTQQLNYIQDQDYVMKKLNTSNQAVSRRRQHNNNIDRSKSYSVLRNEGQLINTKLYEKYFSRFQTQKQKKMHLKNKQLLYKDKIIEIGCMGHRENDNYKITCFITPEIDIILDKVGIESDDNISVRQDGNAGMRIEKRKQERVYFMVNIKYIPYQIPYVYFFFKYNGEEEKVRVFLPVGLHKFFKIAAIDEQLFDQYFKNNEILRGEQIPYSKRALKNLDNIQDYFPHLQKLNRGDANRMGQITYGGEAIYNECRFLIKISVKPNQFLYIQIVNHKKDQNPDLKRVIEFYVATLNNFMMKQISWK